MVRVAGTTMISFSESMTSARVSRSTGRRLSGKANVYQRISPLRTELVPALGLPGEGIVVCYEL